MEEDELKMAKLFVVVVGKWRDGLEVEALRLLN